MPHTFGRLQFDVSSHGGSLIFGELAAAGAAQEQQPAAVGVGGSGSGMQHTGMHKCAPWLSLDEDSSQPSATKVVLSMVSKARVLLEKQQQIEREAQSRCGAVEGHSSVQMDGWVAGGERGGLGSGM